MRDTRWDCTCGSFGIGDAEYTRHAISTSGPHTKYPAAPAAAEPLGICDFVPYTVGTEVPHKKERGCVNWKPLAEPAPQEQAAKPTTGHEYLLRVQLDGAAGNYVESVMLKNLIVEMELFDHVRVLAEPVPQSETRDELRANLIADIHDILIVRHRARVSEQCEEDLSVIIEQYESQLLAAPSPAETSQVSADPLGPKPFCDARVLAVAQKMARRLENAAKDDIRAYVEAAEEIDAFYRAEIAAALARPGDAKETKR